jgi:cytoskeletal protein CcmA (bactofilin family)
MCVHNGGYLLQHPQKKLSVVEKGLTIDGAVSFKGQLIINGTVKGTLVGDHIVITEEGVVVAETRASFITIGGIFRGRLTISGKLVILSTGTCSGIIACQDMELEPGGVLNGEISCGPAAGGD